MPMSSAATVSIAFCSVRNARAAGRVRQPGVGVVAVGADVIGAIGGERFARAAADRKRHPAAGAVDPQRVEPGRAVRTYLETKIVIAGQPEFGAAGIGIGKHHRRGLADAFLGELQADIAAAAVGRGDRRQQRGVGFDTEQIRRARRCVDAEMREVVDREVALVAPERAVIDEHHAVRDRPHAPAGIRREERPRAVLPGRDRLGVTGPCAARTGGDDMALAFRRTRRWCGAGEIEHRDLRRRVDHAQRLVVGNVLLRLAGFEIGQREVGGGGHGIRFSGVTEKMR